MPINLELLGAKALADAIRNPATSARVSVEARKSGSLVWAGFVAQASQSGAELRVRGYSATIPPDATVDFIAVEFGALSVQAGLAAGDFALVTASPLPGHYLEFVFAASAASEPPTLTDPELAKRAKDYAAEAATAANATEESKNAAEAFRASAQGSAVAAAGFAGEAESSKNAAAGHAAEALGLKNDALTDRSAIGTLKAESQTDRDLAGTAKTNAEASANSAAAAAAAAGNSNKVPITHNALRFNGGVNATGRGGSTAGAGARFTRLIPMATDMTVVASLAHLPVDETLVTNASLCATDSIAPGFSGSQWMFAVPQGAGARRPYLGTWDGGGVAGYFGATGILPSDTSFSTGFKYTAATKTFTGVLNGADLSGPITHGATPGQLSRVLGGITNGYAQMRGTLASFSVFNTQLTSEEWNAVAQGRIPDYLSRGYSITAPASNGVAGFSNWTNFTASSGALSVSVPAGTAGQYCAGWSLLKRLPQKGKVRITGIAANLAGNVYLTLRKVAGNINASTSVRITANGAFSIELTVTDTGSADAQREAVFLTLCTDIGITTATGVDVTNLNIEVIGALAHFAPNSWRQNGAALDLSGNNNHLLGAADNGLSPVAPDPFETYQLAAANWRVQSHRGCATDYNGTGRTPNEDHGGATGLFVQTDAATWVECRGYLGGGSALKWTNHKAIEMNKPWRMNVRLRGANISAAHDSEAYFLFGAPTALATAPGNFASGSVGFGFKLTMDTSTVGTVTPLWFKTTAGGAPTLGTTKALPMGSGQFSLYAPYTLFIEYDGAGNAVFGLMNIGTSTRDIIDVVSGFTTTTLLTAIFALQARHTSVSGNGDAVWVFDKDTDITYRVI